MSAPTTWRDRLAAHSAAEKFDELEGAELDALVNDIRQYGLKQPIALLQPDPKVPTYKVLDGRNRLNAAERAGIRLFKEDGTLDWGGGRNFKVVGGDSAFDPVAFVVSANVHRRHLSADDKRKIVADLLRANPERSDRATASIAKVDHKTVAAVRETAEARGEIPHVETRTDTKGRAQPASKPPKAPSKEAQLRALREQQDLPAPARAPAPARGPDRFGIADELEQVLRVLRGDRSRIEQIPLAKRVALARGCLAVLNVTLDDLQPIGGAP